jgi:hypothetical protein
MHSIINAVGPRIRKRRVLIQIGIDFGGTKIEAAALDGDGQFLTRHARFD